MKQDVFTTSDFIAQNFSSGPYTRKEASHLLEKLPLWIARSFQALELYFSNDLKVLVLFPNEAMDAARILTAYRLLKDGYHNPVVVVVDLLTSQVRSALSRQRVEVAKTGEKIFSPSMGLLMKTSDSFQKQFNEVEAVTTQLSMLSRKLVIAYLLNQKIFSNRSFTLTDILNQMVEWKGAERTTLSSLSIAIKALSQLGLVMTHKEKQSLRIQFHSAEDVWSYLCRYGESPVMERAEVGHWLDVSGYPYSGQSALSILSNLRSGRKPIYAVERKRYQTEIAHLKAISKGVLLHEEPIVIEKWIYDPAFLSQEKCVNAIDLALSLRVDSDERVRIELRELLARYELDAERLWNF